MGQVGLGRGQDQRGVGQGSAREEWGHVGRPGDVELGRARERWGQVRPGRGGAR